MQLSLSSLLLLASGAHAFMWHLDEVAEYNVDIATKVKERGDGLRPLHDPNAASTEAMINLILSRGGLYAYYKYLAPKGMKLGPDVLDGLACHLAKHAKHFSLDTMRSRKSFENQVLSPMRRLLFEQTGLPIDPGTFLSEDGYKCAAKKAPKVFAQCVAMMDDTERHYGLWEQNCMSVLVMNGNLRRLWLDLPVQFRKDQQVLAITAATRHGELETVNWLFGKGQFVLEKSTIDLLMDGICANGDIEFFKSSPMVFEPFKILPLAAKHSSITLVEYLAPSVNDLVLADMYKEVAQSGDASFFQYLKEKFGSGPQLDCLVILAATHGNTEILGILLFDREAALEYQPSVYSKALLNAVGGRHYDTVRFLFSCREDGDLMWPSVIVTSNFNVFHKACLNDDILMLEMLFGIKKDGQYLYPFFDKGAFGEDEVLAGLLSHSLRLFQYIIKKMNNNKDPRFASIAFSNEILAWALREDLFEIFELFVAEKKGGNPKFANTDPDYVLSEWMSTDTLRHNYSCNC